MGGRGFSVTRLILVVVLLAALVGIGRIVTPPPAGPPPAQDSAQSAVVEGASATSDPGQPPKSAQDPKQIEMRKKIAEQEKQERMEMMKQMKARKTQPDPNAMTITSDFFRENKMGDAGLKQMDAKMAELKASMPKSFPLPPTNTPKPGMMPDSPAAQAPEAHDH